MSFILFFFFLSKLDVYFIDISIQLVSLQIHVYSVFLVLRQKYYFQKRKPSKTLVELNTGNYAIHIQNWKDFHSGKCLQLKKHAYDCLKPRSESYFVRAFKF